MSQKTNSKSGFTIIEVVLVLAIAGLIFLIVFLALPQLQRSRRDTQRKNDASRLLGALESYAGNSNGQYPTDAAGVTDVVNQYLTTDEFEDPSAGSTYTIVDGAVGSATAPGQGEIYFVTNAKCDPDSVANAFIAESGDRNIAVAIYQEAGDYYCQDNR